MLADALLAGVAGTGVRADSQQALAALLVQEAPREKPLPQAGQQKLKALPCIAFYTVGRTVWHYGQVRHSFGKIKLTLPPP